MVTEPFVDAKDGARQSELRTDIANALPAQWSNALWASRWLAGSIIGVGIGVGRDRYRRSPLTYDSQVAP